MEELEGVYNESLALSPGSALLTTFGISYHFLREPGYEARWTLY